jgi:hypothetical protein
VLYPEVLNIDHTVWWLLLQEQREAAYVDMDKANQEKDLGNTGTTQLQYGSTCLYPRVPAAPSAQQLPRITRDAYCNHNAR